MKYKLQKYSGIASRHECPRCGRQHCFTLYIDENDVPVHESVGRCDHESSCGYNYTPWQYYQDHPPFERLNVLRGRKVVAFPDVDGYTEWRTKLSTMAGLDVTVSDYLERVATPEDRENHVDIADLLIRDNKEPARDSQSQTFLAIREFISPEYHDELEQLIDDLDLELVMLDF